MGTHYHARMEAIGAAEKMLEILEPESIKLDDGTEPLLKTAGLRVTTATAQPVEDSASVTANNNPPSDIADVLEASGDISIEFDRVCFDYEAGRSALSDISLSILSNEHIAIVGQSGAGKSTLMSLLLGFISPQSGSIKINGAPLHASQLATWRKQIAWMPQRAHLFHGSVRENIALGQADANNPDLDQAIKAAAKAAHIAEVIEALPDQYDTHVGERGAGFSGGQIQRIALARAFLKNAPIMLLDEPTAHLDSDSEAHIQQSLQVLMQNRTVISIAHRLNTVQQADRIVMLKDGKVLATGTHDDLLAEQPLYADMVSRFQRDEA